MKNIGIILLTLIITACNYREKNVNKSEFANSKLQLANIGEQDSIRDRYSMFYDYSGDGSKQILGITILDSATVRFHISTRTLPCDTDYWGNAINYAEFDGEIDNDNGEAYPSSQYVSDHDDLDLYIRLADDKSKVIIKFHYKDSLDGTDCVPIGNTIMRRTK